MKQYREQDEPQGVHANTNLSHAKIQAIRDALHFAILSATSLFLLQVRNSNSDGARDGTSESQNCFDESLTRSSCVETVNKQDSVMICELPHCFSGIYSVNDDDVTFVVGPGFFSFAAGGSVSSMVSSSLNAPSIISACHIAC